MELSEQLRKISSILQEIGSDLYVKAFQLQGVRALTLGQFRYLEMIVKNPDITPSELSRLFQVQKPTVTQIITVLLRRGLVEKTVSEDDQRVTHLRCTKTTDSIVAYRNSMFPLFAERVRQVLSGKQVKEYEKLNDLIIKRY